MCCSGFFSYYISQTKFLKNGCARLCVYLLTKLVFKSIWLRKVFLKPLSYRINQWFSRCFMNKNETSKISIFWQYKVRHQTSSSCLLEQVWNFQQQIASNKFTSTALICLVTFNFAFHYYTIEIFLTRLISTAGWLRLSLKETSTEKHPVSFTKLNH